MLNKNIKKTVAPYMLLLPGFVIFVLFFIVPVVTTWVYSFTNYDGFQKSLNFVGFKNYINIIKNDSAYWNSIKNNIILIFCYNTIGLGISLGLAIVLNNVRMKKFFRTCFFLPVVMSTVAIGYTWSYMYDPANGILSSIARLFNLPVVDFLGNHSIALLSVIAVDIWKGQGNNMIILLAGLQTISADLYEAASIDGANKWNQFRYITLPLMKPTISMVILLTTIGCIKSFDLTYVMTQGGPFQSTELMTIRIFNEAFGGSSHFYGYASAQSAILFVLVMIISVIQMRVTRNKED